MYLTAQQYSQRKRFETNFTVDFETFSDKIQLPQETIFLAYTMWGKQKMVKIACEFAQIHFDIIECNSKGEFVRFGYRIGSVHKKEIAERLYKGDWKILNTQTNG